LPEAGDIVRTRYCVEASGRNPYITFWWQLLDWGTTQSIDEFLFTTALQWLAALDPWIDDRYVVRLGTFRNLSRKEMDVNFSFAVTGVPKDHTVRVVEETLWLHRIGYDSSFRRRRSPLPLSNLVVEQRSGRVIGDGQPTSLIEFFTKDHLIIAPGLLTWRPGFIARISGDFVPCTSCYVNPVIFSLKTRSRIASTREEFE